MFSVNSNQAPGANAPLAPGVADASPIARRLRVQLVVLARNPDQARRKIDALVRGAVHNASEATALLQALHASSSVDQVLSGATAPGDASLAPVFGVMQSILAPLRPTQAARPAPQPLRAPAAPSATARSTGAPATSGINAVGAAGPQRFSLGVKTLLGNTTYLDVTADMTVQQLAEAYQLTGGLAPERATYVLGTARLDTSRTLRDYGIGEHMELFVLLKMHSTARRSSIRPIGAAEPDLFSVSVASLTGTVTFDVTADMTLQQLAEAYEAETGYSAHFQRFLCNSQYCEDKSRTLRDYRIGEGAKLYLRSTRGD